MVLTSTLEVDVRGRPSRISSRRTTLPVDGRVLPYVLRNPIMVPSTAMVRTAVAREVGGFDETLRTAEDYKFHLEVARRHAIAVIERPLVFFTDHPSGLSAGVRSYHDQLKVVEQFVAAHARQIERRDRSAALFRAHMRSALGIAYHGQLAVVLLHLAVGARHLRDPRDVPHAGRVAFRVARVLAAQCTHQLRDLALRRAHDARATAAPAAPQRTDDAHELVAIAASG